MSVTTLLLTGLVSLLVPAQARASQDSVVRLSSARPCTSCRITTTTTATISLPGDTLSFMLGSHFARQANGRILAWRIRETGIPAAFSAEGRFERLLARSGSGPGEIGSIRYLTVGSADTVYAFDSSRRMRHVFSPNLQHVRSDQSVLAPTSAVVSASGIRIHAMEAGGAAQAGFPLHIMDASLKVGQSFGRDNPTLSPTLPAQQRAALITRYLEHASPSAFWAYNAMIDFHLEKWDYSGRRILRVERANDGWYQEAAMHSAQFSSSARPGPRWLQTSRQPDMLWIIYSVQTSRIVNRSGGNVTDGAIAESLETVVEAVDTKNWMTRAILRLPRKRVEPVFGSPDEFAVYSHRGDDLFDIAFVRLNLFNQRGK